jgi:Fe-S-cluster containining protein
MTLTEVDVARLEEAGFSDFVRLKPNGDLELKNSNGRCVFLSGASCTTYDRRPDGCRFYPFVLDLRTGRVVRDELCPYSGEFPNREDLAIELRRSVDAEEREAEKRRRGGGGGYEER